MFVYSINYNVYNAHCHYNKRLLTYYSNLVTKFARLWSIYHFNLTFEKSFTDHDSFDFVYTSARSDID